MREPRHPGAPGSLWARRLGWSPKKLYALLATFGDALLAKFGDALLVEVRVHFPPKLSGTPVRAQPGLY